MNRVKEIHWFEWHHFIQGELQQNYGMIKILGPEKLRNVLSQNFGDDPFVTY